METRNHDNFWKTVIFSSAFIASLVLLVYLTATTALTEPIRQWTPASPYTFALANRNAIVHGDYVYVIGGKASSGQATDQVRFAKINVNGSLGTNNSEEVWKPTAILPYPTYLHATAASEDHIYVIGGTTGGEVLYSDVLRAPFLADGHLGPWERIDTYPNVAPGFNGVDLLEALIIDDRLYVFGGWDGQNSKPLTNVYFAEIEVDGIGAWQPTENLIIPTARFAVAYHNGYVYSIGGGYDRKDSDVEYKEVYFAKVNSNGALGNWTKTASLSVPVYYHEAVIHDGELVVLGGRSNSQVYRQIRSSTIRPDGRLNGWEVEETTLPEALYRFSAASLRRSGSNYLYLIGGLAADDSYRKNVYHSDLPPTLTPTPTPGIEVSMSNDPSHWIAPGEEVEYRISLVGNDVADFSDVRVSNTVPEETELIPDSIVAAGASYTFTDGTAGSTIQWYWSEFDAAGEETIAYSVRRQPVPTPDATPLIAIDKIGPETAGAGDPIQYVLTVTNNLPEAVSDVFVEDRMPFGAIYVSGGDGPPVDGIVQWTISSLAGSESRDLELIVTADRTLVNSDFRVKTGDGVYIQGQSVVVTVVDDTPPPPSGDGTTIVNHGSTARWTVNEQEYSGKSNGVRNPMFEIFLPIVDGR